MHENKKVECIIRPEIKRPNYAISIYDQKGRT